MKTHIEIIAGQDILVKVYEPQPLPKRLSVRLKPSSVARKKKQKKQRLLNT